MRCGSLAQHANPQTSQMIKKNVMAGTDHFRVQSLASADYVGTISFPGSLGFSLSMHPTKICMPLCHSNVVRWIHFVRQPFDLGCRPLNDAASAAESWYIGNIGRVHQRNFAR